VEIKNSLLLRPGEFVAFEVSILLELKGGRLFTNGSVQQNHLAPLMAFKKNLLFY
jgi:hypothetical protein